MSDLVNGPEQAEKPGVDPDDLLALMRANLELAIGALDDTRKTEVEDLKFAAGSSDNGFQWPVEVAAARGASENGDLGARPTLTINKIPQHVKQITNEALQNPLAGKVIPADSKANVEVAEIFQGIIRHIESDSDADVAYSTANENQVTFGEGYFRILTEYCDPMTFDQEIKIKRIRNSFSVYMDPTIQDPVGRDQNWCFITEDMLKTAYEKKYPKATPISKLMELGQGNQSIGKWLGKDTIRIAEYFYYDIEMDTLYLYPNGKTAWKGSPEDAALREMYGKHINERESERKKVVKWIKTNGVDILEQGDWAGKWIPVIRVLGNEFEIEGQLYFSGIVRNAKDPQRQYNYWASAEVEMLALAPKAPFIGYGGQFEGYEYQWKTANTKNWAYLEVNPEVDGDGRILPLPQRAQPALPQAGIIAAKQAASEDIKETTGQYNASLGMHSNERTGRAILARQAEGDKSTYHYLSNLSRAIRHMTRILIDLIPKIYDTEDRVVQVMGEDGSTKPVRLNSAQPEAVREVVNPLTKRIEKIYNPNVGKYSVIPMAGPSYATKRQEAAEAMAKIIQTNPEMMGVAGDILVENMDWPGSQRLAKRLAKTIPPELQGDDDDPLVKKLQAENQQKDQQLQQALAMLKAVPQSMEARELDIKAYQAETDRMKALKEGLTLEQVQEIVAGTIDAMLKTGDISPGNPNIPGMPSPQPPMDPMMGQQSPAPPQEPMPPQPPQAPMGMPGEEMPQ